MLRRDKPRFEYRCARCDLPLLPDAINSIERANSNAPVVISYQCECAPGISQTGRFAYVVHALVRLIGPMPQLPYYAPHADPLRFDDQALLRRWRWELEQVNTMDDLQRQFAYNPPKTTD